MPKRKASTGSDSLNGATSSQVQILPEELVLQPVAKSIADENEWPCFQLQQAEVVAIDGKTPVSLLNADLDGPFFVRGKLIVEREEYPLRLRKDYTNGLVEVSDVKAFSIAEDPLTLWAAGKAGWYEIKPSKSYQRIYDEMIEGIDLYWFLRTTHETAREKAKGKTRTPHVDIETLHAKYIDHSKRKLSIHAFHQLCAKHAQFLLSQLRKPGARRDWCYTIFYKWLQEYCADVYRLYEPSVAGASSSRTESTSPRKSSSTLQLGTPVLIVDFMNELHESGRVRMWRMNVSALTKAMVREFDIESEEFAKEVLTAHAKRIFDLLGEEWAVSKIYHKLESFIMNASRRPGPAEKRAMKWYLQRRQKEESEKERSPSPVVIRRSRAGKGGKGAGKGALYRPQGTPLGKRKAVDSDEDPVPQSSKRPRSSKGFVEATSDEEEEVVDDEDQEAEDQHLDEETEAKAEIVLERTILSGEPQGPNGLWTCQKEGCGHTVPLADTPRGKAEVKRHFIEHEDEIKLRQDMVEAAKRPYLPINNLLEKLQRLGEAARLKEQGLDAGQREPTPIQRLIT
jgi:hypothetical protein